MDFDWTFMTIILFLGVLCHSGQAETFFTGDQFIDESIREAINAVDRAIHETKRSIIENPKPSTPGDLHRLFRFPTPETIEIARSQEIFEAIIEKVKDREKSGIRMSKQILKKIAELTGCKNLNQPIVCEDMAFHSKYRTIDGTCNNLEKSNQGAALRPFARLLNATYENGFNEPIGWDTNMQYNGFLIPSPRLVSTTIGSTHHITDHDKITDLVSLWGQFLDHDMDLTPQSPSSMSFRSGVRCNESCANDPPCFPIPIPNNDERIGERCMEFTRSSAVCGSGSFSICENEMVPREQLNAVTSYIDASMVYGSSQQLADDLRAFDGKGRLRVGQAEAATGRLLLPLDIKSLMTCDSGGSHERVPCFLAGDVRSNELTGLTSIHTLFMREHNRICGVLSDLNPSWDDETLYQEARKIVGAEIQHISYSHYLRSLLDANSVDRIMEEYVYRPDIDASIFNMFATAAFRFGHATVKPIIRRLGDNFEAIPEGNLRMHQAFFQPWRIVEQGGIDPILRGFFDTPAKDLNPGELMTDELTEHLFELAKTVALDLMALNLQRGRDHGLPSYTSWRSFCGLGETFNNLAGDISNKAVIDKLYDLYGDPANIDLYLGALVEDPVPGSLLGPTFTCLLVHQFRRTRLGDRFWFENPDIFTPEQIDEIKLHSLARVICDNTNIRQVQRDVFLLPHSGGPRVSCSEIDGMNLTPWTVQAEPVTESSGSHPNDTDA
ncbi:peroxidasin homolog [Glandiceps talaboti]